MILMKEKPLYNYLLTSTMKKDNRLRLDYVFGHRLYDPVWQRLTYY
jgi:hypothetical protein